MDIKLSNNGIVFTNDLQLTESPEEKLRQRLALRFGTFYGTWFMETDYGLDYINDIIGKGRTKISIDSIIRKEISKEKYVDSIISFESSVVDRKYTCKFKVKIKSQTKPIETTFILNEDGLIITDENGLAIIF